MAYGEQGADGPAAVCMTTERGRVVKGEEVQRREWLQGRGPCKENLFVYADQREGCMLLPVRAPGRVLGGVTLRPEGRGEVGGGEEK